MSETASRPTVTVAIPVLDEEAAIAECLDRVRQQTWFDLEVVVADGGSRDGTRAIVEQFAATDARVRLVDNPGRLQAAGLNTVLAGASGEVIVRLDARSFVEPDYVERCVALLDRTGAAVAGGRMVPRPGVTTTSGGIALANRSWWGAGPARFHTGGEAGPADTVYLGTFRRAWLDKVGGWDADMVPNEDYELNHRVRAADGVVWLDPSIEVRYQPRTTYRALARQYFRYGRAKAAVVRRHPRSVSPRQVAPAALAPVAVVAMLGPGRLATAARAGLLAHAGAVGAAASRSSDVRVPIRAAGAAAALVMHWAWSVGVAAGAIRPARRVRA